MTSETGRTSPSDPRARTRSEPAAHFTNHTFPPRAHTISGVIGMETSAELWELFCETGEPMAYLLYRLAADEETAEAISPSA